MILYDDFIVLKIEIGNFWRDGGGRYEGWVDGDLDIMWGFGFVFWIFDFFILEFLEF